MTTLNFWPAIVPHPQNTTSADPPHPVLLVARSAVLLIFFMPPTLTNQLERASLMVLADSLQRQLGGLVRVLRMDKGSHSDVELSFSIIELPTFVLVRRGVELWRQEGLPDEAILVGLIRDLLV